MDGAGISDSGVSVRLAYLCNVYPAVSHSFVRREIEGVEARRTRGASLLASSGARRTLRMSRPARGERTASLSEGAGRFAHGAGFGFLPARESPMPWRGIAPQRAGVRSKSRHVAYWLEAAWLARRMERCWGSNICTRISAPTRQPSRRLWVPGAARRSVSRCMDRTSSMRRFRWRLRESQSGELRRRDQQLLPEPADALERATRLAQDPLVRCGLDRAFLDAPPWPVPNGSTEFSASRACPRRRACRF